MVQVKKILITLAIVALFAGPMMVMAQEKPNIPGVNSQEEQKQPTVQDLKQQLAALQFQIFGAEQAKDAAIKAQEAIIIQGKVKIEELNRQIEKMTPKPKAEVPAPAKPEEKKTEPTKKP